RSSNSYHSTMHLETALRQLTSEPAAPMDVAALPLTPAREEYPPEDVDAYLSELAASARELRTPLRGLPQHQHEVLFRFLLPDLGLRGNARDYHDPRNSYLNDVIDRRTGLPITLTVVAMAVARRADLCVLGVGLPGHFIARAVDGENSVLFDPFHGG